MSRSAMVLAFLVRCLLLQPSVGLRKHKVEHNASCEEYRKIEDGKCADACLPARLGICSRSIIVGFGGLEAGTCSSVGFAIPAGTTEQKAGPCGTLKFNLFEAGSNVRKAESCEHFRKIENGACADACLPEKLGICSRSIIARFGGLQAGTCSSAGFTVPAGSTEQKAGPCGTLKFNLFKPEEANLLDAGSAASCQDFRKIEKGTCADACLPESLGICSRGIIVRFGGLKAGTCSDAGFSIPAGSSEQGAGPCGTLKFNLFEAGLSLLEPGFSTACQDYRKIEDGKCADSCLPETLGICPRSIIARFGGLEAGTCSGVGYSVPAGSTEQKAGPCGTLKFNLFEAGFRLFEEGFVATSCQDFRKIEDGKCADACLPETLGVCPRGIIARFGGLEAGKCSGVGYSVPAGSTEQKAGPCGTLKFNLFEAASSLTEAGLAASCEEFRKIEEDTCADACLPATLGVCPRGIIARFGGLEAGACTSAGFSVPAGSTEQKAGPCGTLKFQLFKQA